MQGEMPVQVLVRATVQTMRPARREGSALLCRDGRVIAVGEWVRVRGLASAPAEILDLLGATVLPGSPTAAITCSGAGCDTALDLSGNRSIAESATD